MYTHKIYLEDPLEAENRKVFFVSSSLFADLHKPREKHYVPYGQQSITVHMMGYETETSRIHTFYTKSGWLWIVDPQAEIINEKWLQSMIDQRLYLALVYDEIREKIPRLLQMIAFSPSPAAKTLRITEFLDYRGIPVGLNVHII